MNVDKQHKLIRPHTVTDAAGYDIQVFEEILPPVEAGWDVWADSAYRTTEIEAHLKVTRLRFKIHRKGYRNKPLPAPEKIHNPNMCSAIRSPRWAAN